MMRIIKLLFLASLFIIGWACNEPQNKLEEVLSSVNGDNLRSHIAYLADDSLKGRLPGTPEYYLAVNYVVEQYKSLGLEPAGDERTYLQNVKVRKGTIDEDNSSFSLNGEILEAGTDYFFLPDLNALQSELTAKTVFAGRGIEAPGLDHNDYQNKDVNGKIVVVFGGAPEDFPASERAHFSNYATKFETAISKGAAGLILIPSATSNVGGLANRFRTRGNTGVVGPEGETFGRRVFGPQLAFVAFGNGDLYQKLFDAPATDVWSNYSPESEGMEGVEIVAKTATVYSEFESPNVVGVLPGGDLTDEYIAHSAHLDHVGIGRAVEGDSIYNGAHDNASGVASLLEIARTYTQLEKKQKRSILFIMVTAEEMGLLGSDYFTRFPTVPIENIVANVNTDMPTLIAPLLSIEPLGAEHSTLMGNVQEAASQMGLEIMPDHMPEQVRFVRSDQYNFIRQGIPALHVKYGLKSSDPSKDLSELINDYTANIYHKPSDELNDLFNFEAGEVYVKVNFLISYSISEDDQRPQWNEDSFFNK